MTELMSTVCKLIAHYLNNVKGLLSYFVDLKCRGKKTVFIHFNLVKLYLSKVC